jgi:hypothetical protein
MKVTMKQTLVTIILSAALLFSLLAGVIRVEAKSAPAYHASQHSTTQLAVRAEWFCPAPPVMC